jgi:hypothetical protein
MSPPADTSLTSLRVVRDLEDIIDLLCFVIMQPLWAAMITYLATPFALAIDGFRVEETAPWRAGLGVLGRSHRDGPYDAWIRSGARESAADTVRRRQTRQKGPASHY